MSRSCWLSVELRSITSRSSGGCSASRRCWSTQRGRVVMRSGGALPPGRRRYCAPTRGEPKTAFKPSGDLRAADGSTTWREPGPLRRSSTGSAGCHGSCLSTRGSAAHSRRSGTPRARAVASLFEPYAMASLSLGRNAEGSPSTLRGRVSMVTASRYRVADWAVRVEE